MGNIKASIIEGFSKLTVETDEENLVTIATIDEDEIWVAGGYRVRLKPKYN